MNNLSERETWISQWVRGYKGYTLRDDRRWTDTLFREYTQERILWFEKRLAELVGEPFLISGNERSILAINLICARLHDLAERVRCIPYSFGEFMVAAELPLAESAPFVARDEDLLRRLAALQSIIDPTLCDSTDMMALAGNVGALVDALSTAVDARQTAISEYAPASKAGATGAFGS